MHPFRTALLFLFVLGTRGLFADANSTKIFAAEYFVDTDPGEGSGTALSAQDGTFDSEVEAIAPVDLNVSGLAVGPHLIGIRYKDDNNTWGEVLYQTIHVYDPNPNVGGSGDVGERVWPPADGTVQRSSQGQTSTWTVSGASYGNGTYTASSSKSLHGDSVHNAFDGIHDVGSWHTSQNNPTGVLSVQMPEGFVISKYEIYRRVFSSPSTHDDSLSPKNWTFEGSNDGTNWTILDTQTNQAFASGVMGEASKKSYSITSNSTAYNYFRINVTANGGGNYLLIGELKLFGKSPLITSAGFATIQAAEYFVDTDPGEGNGTAFQTQDGAFDSEVESILPKDLNVTGLAVGPHLVGVRYQDNNNTWGEVLYQTIHVYDANPDSNASGGGSSGGFATIKGAEYFVDTDPGEGNGTAFQAQDGAFDSEVESILPKDLNVTGLSVGPHLVGVRYQDNNNTWGEVLYQTIHVYDANPDANASGNGGSGGSVGSGGFTVIAGAEYFIGNDPGEGNATALQPKDGAFDSEVESTLTASLSLEGYAIGAYLVGVRYMDNNGTWGDVLFKTIEVDVDTDGDGLADKAEIYYETNSTVQDTDGDGYLDGEEVAFGSDPTDLNSTGNRAPTDLNATSVLSILENLPSGEFVAEFNATDSEANATLSYMLADGNGSIGNAFFSIDANGTLRTAAVLNYEAHASHSIRVRVSDEHNYSSEQTFIVLVQDMDEGTAPALGDGSEQNPYQIATLAHLKWLSFTESVWNQNKHFIQTSDINATETKNWANGYGFSPIGTYSLSKDIRFKGIYDGNGFRIFNLFINRNQQKYVGLFGISLQSSIKNIHIINSSITGESRVGGLVGFMGQTLMENSSFDGNVSGQEYVGGLSGFTQTDTNITKSFSSGKVIGVNERIGGLVGINATHSKIINCYSKSETNGTRLIGGLVGLNETNAKIIRSYSLGLIENIQQGDQSGGLVGANENNATISTSFWDINSSGQSTSAGTGAVGKSTAEMMDPSTFLNAGWDFNQTGGTWKMIAEQTHPRLAWETLPNTTPSDLNSTAPLQVLENQPVGTLVGQFTAEDPDLLTTLTFTLVGGALDNHFFSLDANGTLRTASALDYEANATLTIQAKVRDQHNAWIKQNFIVQILNVVEDLDGDGVEDAYDTDDDGDGYSDTDEIAYSSDPRDVNSTANAAPQITLGNSFPNQLDANEVFHIGHTENKTHIIKVTATDADGDDLNYSIYGWDDLPNFEINASSGDLRFKLVPDYEVLEDHNKDGIFGIILRVSDHKEHHDQPVWIWLVNENESPFDLNSTAPLSIAENQPVGTIVGQLTAQDPDANSTLTFTLVGGSNDNHLFSMDTNGTLKTATQLDYESNSSYSIRAKVHDQNNSSIKRNFTVNVLNVIEDLDQDGIEDAFDPDIDGDGYSNEIELAYPSDPRDPNSVADTLPTNLILSNLEIIENQPVGTVVGQFSVSDPDPNDVSRVRLNENNVSDHQLFSIDANNTLRTAVMFDYENNASTFIVHAKVKQNQVGVFWKSFSLSLLNDPSDDLPSTDNNQTTTPVIDHNTTHDQNTTQPPVIDGNETYDHNATQPVIDGNDPLVENNQTTIEPVTPKYIPIIRTKEVTRNDQGAYVFRGRILSDGGADILEAGFEISQSLGFQETRRLFAQFNGDAFQVQVDDLLSDSRYYYRAFARNEIGESLGSRNRLQTQSLPQSTAWWHALPEQNGRWRTSPWFGSFLPYSDGWLYHAELGWLYAHSGPTVDFWLWSAEHGWLWTGPGIYPYLFQNSSAHWLYFIMKKDGAARFYDYTSKSIK